MYHSWPLRPAVTGSMAIPGLFRPVVFGNDVFIDGGAVNPLPYDLLSDLADIIDAVDVNIWWSIANATSAIAVWFDVRCRANYARCNHRSKNQAAPF